MPATTAFILVGVDHFNDGTITPYDFIELCEENDLLFKMRTCNEQDLAFSGLDITHIKEMIPTKDQLLEDLLVLISIYALGIDIMPNSEEFFIDMNKIPLEKRNKMYVESTNAIKKSRVNIVVSIINASTKLDENKLGKLMELGIKHQILK